MRCLWWFISDPEVYSPIIILRFALFPMYWHVSGCFIPCLPKCFCNCWCYSVRALFCHHPLFFQTSHLALSFPFNPSGFKYILPFTVCAAYVSSHFLSCLSLDLFRSECGGPACYSPVQGPAQQVPVFTGYCTGQKNTWLMAVLQQNGVFFTLKNVRGHNAPYNWLLIPSLSVLESHG